MLTQGIPVGGINTVGQIVATNTLQFHTHQNGLAIAVALLSTHTAGSPMVDDHGRYIGLLMSSISCEPWRQGKISAISSRRTSCTLIY